MAIDFNQEAGKAAAKSVGILGPAFAILIVLAKQLADVDILPEQVEAIVNGVSNWIISGGAILASLAGIYGRIRASEKISSWF